MWLALYLIQEIQSKFIGISFWIIMNLDIKIARYSKYFLSFYSLNLLACGSMNSMKKEKILLNEYIKKWWKVIKHYINI